MESLKGCCCKPRSCLMHKKRAEELVKHDKVVWEGLAAALCGFPFRSELVIFVNQRLVAVSVSQCASLVTALRPQKCSLGTTIPAALSLLRIVRRKSSAIFHQDPRLEPGITSSGGIPRFVRPRSEQWSRKKCTPNASSTYLSAIQTATLQPTQ